MRTCLYDFPDPEGSLTQDGLFALGGDLKSETLLYAYSQGFFPWGDDPVIGWYCPPIRPILPINTIHISHSLKKTLKKQCFSVAADTAFEQVINQCRQQRDGDTWLSPSMVQAYTNLHHLGYAHSVEVSQNGVLVGGLYGVSLGKVFFCESMFHTKTDMSKVAVVYLHDFCKLHDFAFIDIQQMTPTMQAFGAAQMPRAEFRLQVKEQTAKETLKGSWMSIFTLPAV